MNFLLFNFLLQPHTLFGFAQITTQVANIAMGLILFLSLPFRKPKLSDGGISMLAMLFFVSGVVSSLLNFGPEFLLIKEQNLMFWMALNRFGFLLLFVRYVCTRKDFSAILNALVMFGGATAVYTVADYFFHFTYDPNVKGGRAIGLFGDPNYVAANLAALVPFTYYLFLHGIANWLRKLYIVNICSLVMGVFCTASRAGLLVLLLIGAYITKKNIKKISTPVVLGAIILLFIFYGRDLYLKREAKVQTISKSISGKIRVEKSAYARIEHIQWGLQLWLKNPLFGVGVANSQDAIKKELGIKDAVSIHNTYFGVLAEFGAAGFLIYMGIFILPFRALARLSRNKDPYFKEIVPYLLLALLSNMVTSFFLGNCWVELLQWIAIALPVMLDQISEFEHQSENK